MKGQAGEGKRVRASSLSGNHRQGDTLLLCELTIFESQFLYLYNDGPHLMVMLRSLQMAAGRALPLPSGGEP